MNWLSVAAVLLIVFGCCFALGAESYRVPPQEIVDLVDQHLAGFGFGQHRQALDGDRADPGLGALFDFQCNGRSGLVCGPKLLGQPRVVRTAITARARASASSSETSISRTRIQNRFPER